NLGLVYMPADRWRTSFTVSSGFRVPNVDDMAKVFESAGGVQLVVPNPGLKPEYTYNVDIGIAYTDNRIVKIELNGFYTWFRNAIVLDRFTLNGQDSIAYNGANTLVVALQNKARATLHGLSASLTVKPLTGITLHSTITYTYGRYFDPLDNRMPLDHIPPVYGKTSILWQQDWLTGEFFALYN